ncbi:MAG TPA: class I SAM-dependent methyltransferase [Geobacteraceae bacterium]|nr:class I SAM-dependent methyltransferase [Geobacteraceae bacterium]
MKGQTIVNWDERFSEPGYTYGTEPNDFLASVASKIPKGKILSLAEGEGRNAVFLASLGHDVTAVDSSAVGLGKACELAATHHVPLTTVVADLSDFVILPQQWDGIVSCYCHLPPPLRRSIHRAAVAGLKPGGIFVLEAFSKKQLEYDTGGPKSLDMLMSLDELQQELAGMRLDHAVELERNVVEGHGHTGLAAVVQIFAVKP